MLENRKVQNVNLILSISKFTAVIAPQYSSHMDDQIINNNICVSSMFLLIICMQEVVKIPFKFFTNYNHLFTIALWH